MDATPSVKTSSGIRHAKVCRGRRFVALQQDLDFWLIGGHDHLTSRRAPEPQARSQGQLHGSSTGRDRPGALAGRGADLGPR